ncbi:MAG TPA: phosphatidate cytidylyltransferase [Sulfurovum sp.]|jgi:phosphatidate cytidylyltransferase|nr:MAG: phosphatidate cytidylyltransferase [Sulfurovum sp. 35-42-20]OYZ26467.1 MAG: phosphatidate cytidylyltransferase [Sulfurovum sp. 16-42-52]OYZ50093.1 MAG: phosphatidate cytidylyltransferase [Sulfurovum sp. 24-42-9]OZA46331.1 MAG: phosphatidate cytidylyltransferase [Sulfurovum sp. 17-42-90]OZA60424.1 MAG: phosphatidate cytidylyltransferase [Sulfurovum sp. 39-42-12]HQR73241.1 phosphatidate cytidylyltransferase [Sulfurovum sp.]
MTKFFTDYQERWLTGIGLLGVVGLIGWIDNFFVMWTFLGVIYLFAFYEAMRLFKLSSASVYVWAVILWIVAYFYPSPDDLFFLIAVIFASSLAYFHNFDKRLLLPFLYPVSGILFFLILYQDFGIAYMFWLLVVVALTDIGAFFTGKAIGKTKFSDTSPNKTLEGVFGGVAIATIGGSFVGLWVVDGWISVLITFVVAIASIFGDLFESHLKREAGVKDSGDLLPGHGGILDRIDGYLFAAPIMVIALRALT